MELDVTLGMVFTVCPLIFLAAAIDAIAGGGGLISLPAYMVTGIPTVLASGSNKMSASAGSLTALLRYMRGGKLMWKPALFAVAGALPGAYLGAEVLSHTPEQVARIFMFIAFPLMAALLMLRKDYAKAPKPLTRGLLTACFFIGLFVGFYDGFCGPGTGTILIVLFTMVAQMDMVTASGSAKLVNLSSNIAALIVHLINGNVLFPLALPAMACSIAGGYIGAALALKRGAKFVRYLMLAVFAALLIKLVFDTFF